MDLSWMIYVDYDIHYFSFYPIIVEFFFLIIFSLIFMSSNKPIKNKSIPRIITGKEMEYNFNSVFVTVPKISPADVINNPNR